MLSEADKNKYWRIVKKCLIEFHDRTDSQAAEEVRAFRQKLKSSSDVIYHDSPFYMACDISTNRLSLTEFKKKFSYIVREEANKTTKSRKTIYDTTYRATAEPVRETVKREIIAKKPAAAKASVPKKKNTTTKKTAAKKTTAKKTAGNRKTPKRKQGAK